MKRAIAVKDSRGQISAVYFLDDKDLVSEEKVFTRDEWNRGVARMEWEVETTKKVGKGYEVVGNEFEDIGNGFVYRMFFAKKGSFMRKGVNEVVEEYIRKWEFSHEIL